ncbi:MAG TPA: Vps62-related protein [Verrucomicrobiota bacterium]|nr:Vps62-related protein [Verrucomicrobiota bacterium]HNU52082.1 Vps62-related protein [Verrucomicrobiota bacterium]
MKSPDEGTISATRSRTQLAVALLISLAFLAPDLPAADADGDGLDDAAENELMRHFAPLVRLHPADEYRPASVAWYLQRVVMRFYHEAPCSDCPEGIAGWSTAELLSKSHPTKDADCEHNYSNIKSSWNTTPSPSDVTHFFLEIPHDANMPVTQRGALSSAVCYAHVRSAVRHPRMFDIQYWFFYPYNGAIPFAAHEGDWEHITVRVEEDRRTVHRVFYDAHNTGGRWFSEGEYSLENGRPVVYSAFHSHASYPGPGTWYNGADHTGDGGPVWDCLDQLVNLGEGNAPSPGCEWIWYTGRWGEYLPYEGPEGPAFKAKWNAEYPEEDISDHAWVFVAQSSPAPGDGSWAHPFHEFTDGARAVPAGGTVWIFAGAYPAVGSYTKPMTLRSVAGEVLLGR